MAGITPGGKAPLALSTAQPLRAAIAGYRLAAPAERAGFAILSALAVTIAVARAITYGMERDRNAPRLRSWLRRAYQSIGGDGVRVHHFVPGVALTSAAGATSILTRTDGHEFSLGVPLGTGIGLVLDEVGLLVKSDNPYWRTEALALIEGSVAGLTAAALLVRFHRRGAAHFAEAGSAGVDEAEREVGP